MRRGATCASRARTGYDRLRAMDAARQAWFDIPDRSIRSARYVGRASTNSWARRIPKSDADVVDRWRSATPRRTRGDAVFRSQSALGYDDGAFGGDQRVAGWCASRVALHDRAVPLRLSTAAWCSRCISADRSVRVLVISLQPDERRRRCAMTTPGAPTSSSSRSSAEQAVVHRLPDIVRRRRFLDEDAIRARAYRRRAALRRGGGRTSRRLPASRSRTVRRAARRHGRNRARSNCSRRSITRLSSASVGTSSVGVDGA